MKTLSSKLDDLKTCNDLIVKHGAALQKSLIEVEIVENSAECATKIKSVNERATVFRITTNAMLSV